MLASAVSFFLVSDFEALIDQLRDSLLLLEGYAVPRLLHFIELLALVIVIAKCNFIIYLVTRNCLTPDALTNHMVILNQI